MRAVSAVPTVAEPGAAPPTFRDAVRVWAKIGLINFGGPAGQIAIMHRILVEEKGWIDEKRFLHALNYCMLLPGPEAQQLATYIGWLLHGTRGGLAAGLFFIVPGFFVLLALSIAYALLGDIPIVQGILFGLKAAVLAIVAEALLRVSRRALKSPAAYAIAIAAFVAIAFLAAPFPAIIAAAALAGFLLTHWNPDILSQQPTASDEPVPLSGPDRNGHAGAAALKSVLVWGAIWLVPVALLAAVLGLQHVFTEQALFFSKAAIVTFGGAYAVLAYVAQQAVEVHGWLRPDEMLTGLGLAETTPGPLILVLVFVGFLAGFRGETGLDPLAGGVIGALITLWVTFAPSFLFIFAGAPFIERLRGNRALAGALAAVTAAVVGVIANLALWFGLHVLFAEVGAATIGPVSLPAPDWSSFDPAAALIALAAGVALLRLHANVVLVLGLAAAAGAVLRLAG
ncbi:MAG: chromate efflux transporter [Pseudomonadota bacterium]|nr:chromate efflux transporter [Pseudomonadota bacterium]